MPLAMRVVVPGGSMVMLVRLMIMSVRLMIMIMLVRALGTVIAAIMVMDMTVARRRMIVVVLLAFLVLVRHWPLPFQILVDDFDEFFGGEHLW